MSLLSPLSLPLLLMATLPGFCQPAFPVAETPAPNAEVLFFDDFDGSELDRERWNVIGIATLVALPLAWLLTNSWLQGFAYRISSGVGTFGLGLLILLTIAASAIGSQTLKAALANPIDHLHDE
jgi:hypothetical protein